MAGFIIQDSLKRLTSKLVQKCSAVFRQSKKETYKIVRLIPKPLVVFPKSIIESVTPYRVNKNSYIKPGSKIAQTHKEDKLFDNMFEIVLRADYEDYTD